MSIYELPIEERRAIVNRFEERVDAAQRANPPTMEWVRLAVRRQGAVRCPVRMKRLSTDIILRYGSDLAEILCEYPDDVIAAIPYDITVGYQRPGKRPYVDPLRALTEAMEWTDEWGTRWGHAAGGVGATPVAYPLASWDMMDYYLARIPDPCEPGRLAGVAPLLRAHSATKYCYGIIHLALFERLHALRGMDATFVDLHTNRNDVERLLDALEAYLIPLIQAWADLGASAVFLTDDWGSQTALMISPRMWRAMFKVRYRRLVEAAHQAGIDFILHSCGNVIDIIGDLADVGVDILDPIQSGAMDIEEVARRYGGAIAFSGAIDIQGLLVEGTPAQVHDGVRRTIDRLARPFGNALILGPANVMTPETPLANIRAMCEASRGL